MTRRALLLIDIQNDYFPEGRYPLVGIEAAAENAARLLAAARAAGETVVHVRHEFAMPDAPFFSPGTEGAQIHPSVAPLEGETVVLKHQVNAFRDTDLKAVLDAAGVEELTVAGGKSALTEVPALLRWWTKITLQSRQITARSGGTAARSARRSAPWRCRRRRPPPRSPGRPGRCRSRGRRSRPRSRGRRSR